MGTGYCLGMTIDRFNYHDIVGMSPYEMIYGRKCRTTARSQQKSYVDIQRSDLEFQVGDHVLLKVSLWKGVLALVGRVAYRLDLPETLSQIHNTFHLSQLQKCLADETAYLPLDDIQVDEIVNYVEKSVAVDLATRSRDVEELSRAISRVNFEDEIP
ncbi:hypothetical protein OSB04_024887 [Centaurea solstitialis]|uniref:Tf2-1-like SH3-like domain-containing protein n=1 Tax=Centaurea solstitialis TaxID=347529 RepID=A0AA38WAT6_9ASTR|nr:hypothetical protein OSB04_024887 [Centaurea solstitialis]